MSLHYDPIKQVPLTPNTLTKQHKQPKAIITTATQVKQRIWQIVNAFETGSSHGEYHALTVQTDGRNGSRQISYGRSQVTEQGHLKTLLRLYCQRQGQYSQQLAPYLSQLKQRPLYQEHAFKNWLIKAGKTDPIMAQCQDDLFDQHYWQPALNWAKREGFVHGLSWLVIYDSYIHSGHIMAFLRKRFVATTPKYQGCEQLWISQYTQTRHHWLANHKSPLLRASRYRTQCLLNLIKQNNWQLDQLPIIAHGVTIT